MTQADKDATCTALQPPRRVACIPISMPISTPLLLSPQIAEVMKRAGRSSSDSSTSSTGTLTNAKAVSEEPNVGSTRTTDGSTDLIFDEAAVREFASAADAAAALGMLEADIQRACNQGSEFGVETEAEVSADKRLNNRSGGPVGAWWVQYSTEPRQRPRSNTKALASIDKEIDDCGLVQGLEKSGTNMKKASASQGVDTVNEETNRYKRKPVVLLDDLGNVLARYESQTLAAEALGITKPMVSTCVHGMVAKAANKHRLRSVALDGIYPTLNDEGWTEDGRPISSSSDLLSDTRSGEGAKEGTHRRKRKAVVLLDDQGNVLSHYESQNLAAEALGVAKGVVSTCVCGHIAKVNGKHRLRSAVHDGKYLSLADEGWTEDSQTTAAASAARTETRTENAENRRRKAVVLLDDQGNVLSHYESQSLAAEALGVTKGVVSDCVRGVITKAANKYRLRKLAHDGKYLTVNEEARVQANHIAASSMNSFQLEGDVDSVEKVGHSKQMAVVLLDDHGNVLSRYDSQKLAAEALGVSQQSVSRCVRGLSAKAEGMYRFQAASTDDKYTTLVCESRTGNELDSFDGNCTPGADTPSEDTVITFNGSDSAAPQSTHPVICVPSKDKVNITSELSSVTNDKAPDPSEQTDLEGTNLDGDDRLDLNFCHAESESGSKGKTTSASYSAVSVRSISGHHRRKEVVVLDKGGQITHEFPSISAASIALAVPAPYISNCINRKSSSAGGFVFRFKQPLTSTQNEPAETLVVRTRSSNHELARKDSNLLRNSNDSVSSSSLWNYRRKEVVLLGKDGQIVREFPSVSAASVALDVPAPYVSNCINGKIPDARGFILRFKHSPTISQNALDEHLELGSGSKPVSSVSTENNRRKEIVLLDESGLVTREFSSSSAAALALDVPAPYISLCINRKIPNARGFVLRFKHPPANLLDIPTEALELDKKTRNQGSNAEDSSLLCNFSNPATTTSMGDHSRKEIVLLDENGLVTREFPSGTAASAALGVPQSYVSLCINGKIPDARGFVLRFKHPPVKSQQLPAETSTLGKRTRNQSSSAMDSDLYVNSGNSISSSPMGNHSRKEVVLLDEYGKVTREFPSGSAASAALNVPQAYVSMCVNGKLPDACGFVLRLKHLPGNAQESSSAVILELGKRARDQGDQDSTPKDTDVSLEEARRSAVKPPSKEKSFADDTSAGALPSPGKGDHNVDANDSYVPLNFSSESSGDGDPVVDLVNSSVPLGTAETSSGERDRVVDYGVSSIPSTLASKPPGEGEVVKDLDDSSAPLDLSYNSPAERDLVVDCNSSAPPDSAAMQTPGNEDQLFNENDAPASLKLADEAPHEEKLHLDDENTSALPTSADKSRGEECVIGNDRHNFVPLDTTDKTSGDEDIHVDDDGNICDLLDSPDKSPDQKVQYVDAGDTSAPLDTANTTPGESDLVQDTIVVCDGDLSAPLNTGAVGLGVDHESVTLTEIAGTRSKETRHSNRLAFINSGAASNTAVSTTASLSQASDRHRAGVLPGLSNPNQGPRHRLLIGATVPNMRPPSFEDSTIAPACRTETANSLASTDVSSSASPDARSSLEYAQNNTGALAGVSSDSLQPLSDVRGDDDNPTKRPKWQVVASSHAPSHARARELWRCMQRNESSLPENHALAPPVDHLTETQSPHSTSEEERCQTTKQVVLPGTVYQPQPLVSSAVNHNASGTCKAWRLTPVTVRTYF